MIRPSAMYVSSLLLCIIISSVQSAYSGNRDKVREECDDEEYVKGEDGLCCPRPVSKEHTTYTCSYYDPSCWVYCDEGYIFPDTQNKTQVIECREGQWMSWTGDTLFSGILCERMVTTNDSVDNTGRSSVPDTGMASTAGTSAEPSLMGVCNDIPRIKNAVLQCSSEDVDTTWSCVATCKSNYVLPNGNTRVEYIHEGGSWKVKGSDQPADSMKSCFESMVTSGPPTLPQPEHFRDTERSRKPVKGSCEGELIPPEETIGLVQISTKHGICRNTQPLKGMVRCAGSCHSHASYALNNAGMRLRESTCLCCQARPPSDAEAVMVYLKCEKFSQLLPKSMKIPTKCYCGPCTESQVVTTTSEPLPDHIDGCPENVCD